MEGNTDTDITRNIGEQLYCGFTFSNRPTQNRRYLIQTRYDMRKLNKFNITCIILLYGYLCYLLIDGYEGFTTRVILTMIASGIIIFVPIYKHLRNKKQ